MLFINKLFNSIACLLSFTNLQLVIPGRTWILLYLGRTVYKRLWACLNFKLIKKFIKLNIVINSIKKPTFQTDTKNIPLSTERGIYRNENVIFICVLIEKRTLLQLLLPCCAFHSHYCGSL